MKPFLKKNLTEAMIFFYHRLSRCRRVSEIAFVKWVSVCHLFGTRAQLSPEKAKTTVMACLVFHYMLRTESEKTYTSPRFLNTDNDGNITQGSWKDYAFLNILPLSNEHGYKNNISAEDIRQIFCAFFYRPGQVPWQ